MFRTKYLFAADIRVDYTAYFANLGPNRPREQILDPKDSPDLPKYLKRKKLTLKDFHALTEGVYEPPQEGPPQNFQCRPDQFPPGPEFSDFDGRPVGPARNIAKIQTEHGLVLSTRRTVEMPDPNPMVPVHHTPSRRIEEEFLKTNRLQPLLQDFREDDVAPEPDVQPAVQKNPLGPGEDSDVSGICLPKLALDVKKSLSCCSSVDLFVSIDASAAFCFCVYMSEESGPALFRLVCQQQH